MSNTGPALVILSEQLQSTPSRVENLTVEGEGPWPCPSSTLNPTCEQMYGLASGNIATFLSSTFHKTQK